MKNKQLSVLLQGALACQDVKGLKFAYALQKNIRLMKQAISSIFELLQPTPGFNEYEKDRIKLAEKFSEKDKDGKPKTIEDGSRFKIKDKKKFEAELKKLQKKHEKAINHRQDQEHLFNEKLEEECTVNFHFIKEKDLPENLSLRQLDIISSFMYELPADKKREMEEERERILGAAKKAEKESK